MNIAAKFVSARKTARLLQEYPGELPKTLDQAYQIQEHGLKLMGEEFGGWKVAMILPDLRAGLKSERLAGPILRRALHDAQAGQAITAQVYENGFAALEAEFCIVIGEDLPKDPEACTMDVVKAAVRSMHAGVEIASSPLAILNDLGPLGLVSDFGGNAGGIIGPEIADWREKPLESMLTRTSINGEIVGEGSAARVPGGPLAAVLFLARQLAGRGRHLRRGDAVLTGMTTGVHEVKPGDKAVLEFPGTAAIQVEVAAIGPR